MYRADLDARRPLLPPQQEDPGALLNILVAGAQTRD